MGDKKIVELITFVIRHIFASIVYLFSAGGDELLLIVVSIVWVEVVDLSADRGNLAFCESIDFCCFATGFKR